MGVLHKPDRHPVYQVAASGYARTVSLWLHKSSMVLAAGFVWMALFSIASSHAQGPAYREYLAGVGPQDPRQKVDTRQMPWAAIGRVQTELGSRCTGFLLSPVVVQTAAHCLWLSATHRFVQPESVHFLLAYSGGHYSAHARVTHFVIPPGYTTAQENQLAGLDHATLILDHPVAKPDAVFHVTATLQDVTPGTSVSLGGYEQNQPDIITADTHCHLTGTTQDGQGNLLLTHDCAGTHGSSGAPLLRQNATGWQVVGVQALAHTAGAGGDAVPLLATKTP